MRCGEGKGQAALSHAAIRLSSVSAATVEGAGWDNCPAALRKPPSRRPQSCARFEVFPVAPARQFLPALSPGPAPDLNRGHFTTKVVKCPRNCLLHLQLPHALA